MDEMVPVQASDFPVRCFNFLGEEIVTVMKEEEIERFH